MFFCRFFFYFFIFCIKKNFFCLKNPLIYTIFLQIWLFFAESNGQISKGQNFCLTWFSFLVYPFRIIYYNRLVARGGGFFGSEFLLVLSVGSIKLRKFSRNSLIQLLFICLLSYFFSMYVYSVSSIADVKVSRSFCSFISSFILVF